jgi:uncharacterized membrane protein
MNIVMNIQCTLMNIQYTLMNTVMIIQYTLMNTLLTPDPAFFKINIILFYLRLSIQWSPTFRIFDENFACISDAEMQISLVIKYRFSELPLRTYTRFFT